jgi:hypothetical protein
MKLMGIKLRFQHENRMQFFLFGKHQISGLLILNMMGITMNYDSNLRLALASCMGLATPLFTLATPADADGCQSTTNSIAPAPTEIEPKEKNDIKYHDASINLI